MKNYIGHIFTFLFLTTSYCYSGQAQTDTTNMKTDRFNFSFALGTQYHTLLGNRHFPLDTFGVGSERFYEYFDDGGCVGYTYIPTFGLHSALLCNYSLKRMNFETGILFYFRQEKNIMNNDTAERNIVNVFNSHYSAELDTFKEINYTHFNIVFPFYCGYTFNRFSCLIGAKLSTYTFSKKEKHSINNYKVTLYNSLTRYHSELFPSFKFRYLVINKKNNISTYFEIDKRYLRHYDFLLGIEIKLYTLK